MVMRPGQRWQGVGSLTRIHVYGVGVGSVFTPRPCRRQNTGCGSGLTSGKNSGRGEGG